MDWSWACIAVCGWTGILSTRGRRSRRGVRITDQSAAIMRAPSAQHAFHLSEGRAAGSHQLRDSPCCQPSTPWPLLMPTHCTSEAAPTTSVPPMRRSWPQASQPLRIRKSRTYARSKLVGSITICSRASSTNLIPPSRSHYWPLAAARRISPASKPECTIPTSPTP